MPFLNRLLAALLLVLTASPTVAEQRVIFLGDTSWLTNVYDPVKMVFEENGYKIEVMPLLCDADLACWRRMANKDPNWFIPFVAEAAEKLTDCGCVLVGTSRAGFFALEIAARTNIPRVVAIAPVVDLGALDEFRGSNQPASALT
jgi:hypothetical protein